jgi:hypothetical protein
MAEPQDAVMPILRKIQNDIAMGFNRVDAQMKEMNETLLDHGDRLRKIEANTAFHRGMTLQHQFELDTLRQDVDGLKSRLAVLEEKV